VGKRRKKGKETGKEYGYLVILWTWAIRRGCFIAFMRKEKGKKKRGEAGEASGSKRFDRRGNDPLVSNDLVARPTPIKTKEEWEVRVRIRARIIAGKFLRKKMVRVTVYMIRRVLRVAL